ADPDPTGIAGLVAAVQARACREGVRLHVQVKVDCTDIRETDPGLLRAFAHLLGQGLERARTGSPGERAMAVGFIRAPQEHRVEVWAAGATPEADGWGVASIRPWVEEAGGTVEVEAPRQGGSLVRLSVPVTKAAP